MTLPNPRGTEFVHDRDRDGRTSAFHRREPDADFERLSYSLERDWPKARAHNAKALHQIALEILSEPRPTDPNVRYAREVHQVMLKKLMDLTHITLDEFDELTAAFDTAVEHSANAVASAWLRERGSIPIPGE
jgi:hypothetical protein